MVGDDLHEVFNKTEVGVVVMEHGLFGDANLW